MERRRKALRAVGYAYVFGLYWARCGDGRKSSRRVRFVKTLPEPQQQAALAGFWNGQCAALETYGYGRKDVDGIVGEALALIVEELAATGSAIADLDEKTLIERMTEPRRHLRIVRGKTA